MKMIVTPLYACWLVVALFTQFTEEKVYTESELETYLRDVYEVEESSDCTRVNEADWAVSTDLGNATKENAKNLIDLELSRKEKEMWTEYFREAGWHNFTNTKVKRQLMILSELGLSALDDRSHTELNAHMSAMGSIYSRGKICPYNNQQCNLATEGLSLNPDIETILQTSQDYDELTYVWTAWRNVTGPRMKGHYKKYVKINNLAAKLNGYKDMGELWRNNYDTATFVEDMDKLWAQVKPLYVQLHMYVRRKLEIKFGNQLNVEADGLLPGHIFGNMWAQSWVNLYDLVQPYPKASPVNLTSALIDQNYTVLKMFETSDNFFKSLGLPSNAMSYDVNKAMITKPLDRDVVCHASAWDFCNGNDFRIKMCSRVNGEDFVTIHHEMGHIQYYIQYKDQPYAFRQGANLGFHEAVGDTIALSVHTPYHLRKIGLIPNYTDSKEDSLNALMHMALLKIAFMPFGLLVDKWRWDVFSGKVNDSAWNAHWWHLRETIQLIKSPVERTEAAFDPGSKYHISADEQYISYFIALILQFQLHKELCIEAGQYDPDANSSMSSQPLHKCDIYGSLEAGKKLMKGLKLGASQHWTEVLHTMIGSRKLDATALLEYFQPLSEYLEHANAGEIPTTNRVIILVGTILVIVCLVTLLCYITVLVRKKKKNAQSLNIPTQHNFNNI